MEGAQVSLSGFLTEVDRPAATVADYSAEPPLLLLAVRQYEARWQRFG